MSGVNVRQRTKKNKDGSIKKCSWEYRFSVAIVDGKYQRFEKGGFKTKAEAVKAGTKAYNEYLNTGHSFTPSEISFSDFLDVWMKQYCEINLKNTTVQSYNKYIKNYLKPALGSYKLCQISSLNLQEFINNKFNEGFSRNTLTSLKGIISGSFAYAENTLQLIKKNPAIGVKLPLLSAEPKTESRHHDRMVVPQEVMKIVFQRFPEGHPSHIPLQLGYRCGLRLGEAFGLTWDDVDLNAGIININHQVQYDNNTKCWRLMPPKYNSYRKIKLDDYLLSLLKRTKEIQSNNKAEYEDLYCVNYIDEKKHIVTVPTSKCKECKLVNVRVDGSYIQPRTIQHTFRVIHDKDNPKSTNKVNEPLNLNCDFDFHSLRHTHATMLLSAGVSPVVVKERLGHKNIETTLGIYAHVTQSMEDSVLTVMNNI